MCNCQNFTKILIGNDESNPLSEIKELEWSPELWATLHECPDCNQLWHIDIAKKGELGLCVKVDSLNQWQTLDLTQLRIQFFVSNRGGLSEETCKWKQCQNYCVKGLAFCPNHAYFEMDIKA